jgi:hypothetical protein
MLPDVILRQPPQNVSGEGRTEGCTVQEQEESHDLITFVMRTTIYQTAKLVYSFNDVVILTGNIIPTRFYFLGCKNGRTD